MIELRNIAKKGDLVTCDIFPEDAQAAGKIVYSISLKTAIETSLPDGYSWCTYHLAKAIRKIEKMISDQKFEDSVTVMWY